MPQPVLHVFLANRTLAHWRRARYGAPFPLDDAAAVNAFRHGTLGPDMGLFPWSEKLISRLAHTSRTGAIARDMIDAASTHLQRAFAWGWVSHVIADAAIHPLVNDAADRLDATSPVAGAPFLVRHVTAEVGLDAFYVRRMPELLNGPLRDAFDRDDLDFLAGSLRRTYGVAFDRATLDASHRNVTRFYRLYLVLQRMIAAEQTSVLLAGSDSVPASLRALRLVLSPFVKASSPSFGFLYPAVPDRALLEGAESVVRDFDERLDALLDGGLPDLPDYDLETGELPQDRLESAEPL
jgi:hypothetical protein